jgi:hypothetical protein
VDPSRDSNTAIVQWKIWYRVPDIF